MSPPKVLLVTNDFPPRPGGIQSFLDGLVSRLPPDRVVVYTSRWKGWQEWDARQSYEVVRADTSVLLPTPSARRDAVALLRSRGCDTVWFGAAAPLGLLARPMRAAGAHRLVATTHGHEIGWAATPGARQLLHRIVADMDVVTYLGEFTRARLAPVVGADRLRQLTPGVDTDVFRPGLGAGLRADLGLAGRPVVVCVSRLMPRKGQDALIDALPIIRRRVRDAALLLVGGGPSRRRLEQRAAELGLAGSVVFTGSVPAADLPAYYGAGDVFAMPCRTRLGGLDVEGLGMVFLEAAACGLPVVAGRSGGSPDAVLDETTGFLIDGRVAAQVADRVAGLLADPAAAKAMGARGRDWVRSSWSWQRSTSTLLDLLAGEPS